MRVRDYGGPLAILAAGVIGFSLLCSVSAMAMSDLENYIPATFAPLDIVDMAISNLSTAAAFTEQSVTEFVPTPTLVPTRTKTLTPQPSDTATLRPTFTRPPPTRTRRSDDSTNTPRPPTRTDTPVPTDTPIPSVTPSRTSSPIPTDTPTPEPTQTPIPPSPTDTEVPPTDTPVPPTIEPPPTSTIEALPSDVPISLPEESTALP